MRRQHTISEGKRKEEDEIERRNRKKKKIKEGDQKEREREIEEEEDQKKEKKIDYRSDGTQIQLLGGRRGAWASVKVCESVEGSSGDG